MQRIEREKRIHKLEIDPVQASAPYPTFLAVTGEPNLSQFTKACLVISYL